MHSNTPSEPSRGQGAGGVHPALPGKEVSRRWLRRAVLTGAVVSIAIHVVALIIAALTTVTYGTGDASGSASRQVELALVSDDAGAADVDLRFDVDLPELPDGAAADELPPLDAGPGPASQTSALGAGELSLGGGNLGAAAGLDHDGLGGAGGGGASFFGLESSGRRFVYIVDVSGSMNAAVGNTGRTRMELTRSELSQSIDGLLESAEFAIILFSSRSSMLGGRSGWTEATERNRREARTDIARIEAGGGTIPTPAFEIAFALQPPPDAIYFMTDGIFADSVPGEVAAMNRELDVPVNAIMFGDFNDESERRRVERMMRQIANESGGRFTHRRGAR